MEQLINTEEFAKYRCAMNEIKLYLLFRTSDFNIEMGEKNEKKVHDTIFNYGTSNSIHRNGSSKELYIITKK